MEHIRYILFAVIVAHGREKQRSLQKAIVVGSRRAVRNYWYSMWWKYPHTRKKNQLFIWPKLWLNREVSLTKDDNSWIRKIGVINVIDAIRMITIPINFIPNPTLIKSIILTFPLANIIALGGVAKNTEIVFELLWKKNNNIPIGNINERDTLIHDGNIRRAAGIPAACA